MKGFRRQEWLTNVPLFAVSPFLTAGGGISD